MQQETPIWLPRSRELAPWAVHAEDSRGRRHDEPPCPMRTPYQRDRDRIVHATAFRRLNYKTQVFLLHEGDHYRSRLTHSLEVAQIARAIARQLGLDEDLAEALALAHDLGHPPFGHAGERALDRAMQARGGFDHNAQSLRVVTRLERKYWAFDGLNLAIETLEGLVKHNGPVDPERQPLLVREIRALGLERWFELGMEGPAEGQTAAIADDIAYNNHDIDDALRAGLVRFEDLADVPLAGRFVRDALRHEGERAGDHRRAIWDVNRRMITAMVEDVIAATLEHIRRLSPRSVDDVRRAGEPLVAFSAGMTAELEGLRRFLFGHVYRHERVMRAMRNAEAIVGDLFACYAADLRTMPGERGTQLEGFCDPERLVGIGDFIAGMTDRFAVAEHRRLFASTPELS